MVILWILLGLVLFFAILLSLSITVYVKIGETVDIKVGLAGYRYPLVPMKEKPEKPKKEPKTKKAGKKSAKKEKTKTEPPAKKANDKSLFETVQFVLDLLGSVLPGAVGLLRKIRFTNMRIFLSVGADDADQTAIRFGQMNAAVYNLLACIDQAMTLKVKDVSIVPDFITGELRYDVSFKAKLRIGGVVASAFGILFRLIGTFMRQTDNHNTAKPPHATPKAVGKPKNERMKSE